MRILAVLEHEDKLVLAAVQRTHARVVLRPDTDVLELGIGLLAGLEELAQVPPVHADEVQRSVTAVTSQVAAHPSQKRGELCFRHFTGSHRKLAVMCLAFAADVAVDGHIVRWIRENHLGALLSHEPRIAALVEGISAQGAVLAHLPQVTEFADSDVRGLWQLIRGILVAVARRGEVLDEQIDLSHLETGESQG